MHPFSGKVSKQFPLKLQVSTPSSAVSQNWTCVFFVFQEVLNKKKKNCLVGRDFSILISSDISFVVVFQLSLFVSLSLCFVLCLKWVWIASKFYLSGSRHNTTEKYKTIKEEEGETINYNAQFFLRTQAGNVDREIITIA